MISIPSKVILRGKSQRLILLFKFTSREKEDMYIFYFCIDKKVE